MRHLVLSQACLPVPPHPRIEALYRLLIWYGKINLKIYKSILNELTPELSIKEVDLSKYEKEAVKTLFMNNYLYRLSKKLIISDLHKNSLIELLKDLPDIFTVKEFKDLANLSRKYAIPYLEFLDSESLTAKIEDSGKRKKLV